MESSSSLFFICPFNCLSRPPAAANRACGSGSSTRNDPKVEPASETQDAQAVQLKSFLHCESSSDHLPDAFGKTTAYGAPPDRIALGSCVLPHLPPTRTTACRESSVRTTIAVDTDAASAGRRRARRRSRKRTASDATGNGGIGPWQHLPTWFSGLSSNARTPADRSAAARPRFDCARDPRCR